MMGSARVGQWAEALRSAGEQVPHRRGASSEGIPSADFSVKVRPVGNLWTTDERVEPAWKTWKSIFSGSTHQLYAIFLLQLGPSHSVSVYICYDVESN
jgi:hypothetical protein